MQSLNHFFIAYNFPYDRPFPPSEFDPWVETYDQDVINLTQFSFDDYEQVLDQVVRQANPRAGMSLLDIDTGTGNLALRFAELGSELWCTDFSEPMLEKARAKLPTAHFISHDFRTDWPAELESKRFDRIVSAYVFHHVGQARKIGICKKRVGDKWDDAPYWIVGTAIPALEKTGLRVE